METLRGLAVGAPRGALGPVREGLLDADPAVRVAAAEAARTLRLVELEPTLIGGLGAGEASVREAFVRALGSLGAEGTAPAVVRALSDTEPAVRAAAAAALAELQSETALVALLNHLDDADTHVRLSIVRAVGALGERSATLPLLTHLRDPVPEVRAAVVQALGALRDSLAEGALLGALTDSSEDVVLAALAALGATAGTDALDVLKPWLHQRDARRAQTAYAALAYLDAPRALDEIVEGAQQRRLRELTPSVFAHALDTHPQWREDAESTLARALRNARSKEVRDALLLTLPAAGLSPDSPALSAALGDLLAAHVAPSARLLSVLSRSEKPESCLHLLEQTAEPSAANYALLDALERCVPHGQGIYAEPLQQWLAATPEPARQARIIALIARAGAARSGPALLPWLSAEAPRVRIATLRALSSLGHGPAATAALSATQDSDPAVRQAAAAAVGALCDARMLTTLVEEITRGDPSHDRRRHVLHALAGGLSRHGDAVAPRARKALFEVLRDGVLGDTDEVEAALSLRALVSLGGDGVDSTLAQIGNQYPQVRRVAATRALAELPPAEAARRLQSAARDPDRHVAATALIALAPLADADAVPWLRRLTREANWPVGPAAAHVLARIALSGSMPRDPTHRKTLCELAAASDPHTSANGIAALAAVPGIPCRAPLSRWAAQTPVDVRVRAASLHLDLDLQQTAAEPRHIEAPRPTTWTSVQYADGSVAIVHPDALGSLGAIVHPTIAVEPPWSAAFLD